MALLDIRSRAGYLFIAVLLGHVILISAQVSSRSGVPVLESVTFGFFAEIQRGTWSVVSNFRNVWSNYVDLRRVRTENEELRRQLAETQIALQEQRALADRRQGLEQLLALRDRTTLRTTGAEIIAAGASNEFKTVTIDKGTRDGLQTDLAVIAPAGIVGRIVVPSANAAKVQLLIDRNAAAGAIVERRESRAQGIVVGTGDPRDPRLRMEDVSEVADVAVGDTILTSGIEGIYPKGLVIGRVEVVEKTGANYKQILVRPAVNFSNLEQVLVVLTPTAAAEAKAAEAKEESSQ
jgi:rod shape-determining protein MreC